MKVLIAGICGFVGGTLARAWLAEGEHTVFGLDNFIRPGSETNRQFFRERGVQVFHGDIRSASDFETLPGVDYVIDAAANPSVLAGIDGRSSSRQVVEHNLGGTVNMLEFCRARRAGFILLSTSRVYSIPPLARLEVAAVNEGFQPRAGQSFPTGCSPAGVSEEFSTAAPVSLYGGTKLASEALALEYGQAFGFPVWINRCGVLAGAGQFGFAEQGIFSYWVHAWAQRRPLKYIGFGGLGHQVRDALHPQDLIPVLDRQMQATGAAGAAEQRIFNLAGGAANAMSLANLSRWCGERFGAHAVAADPSPRPYDIPWMVLDCARAERVWGFRPRTPLPAILDQIADFARANPQWLDLSAPGVKAAGPSPAPGSGAGAGAGAGAGSKS